MGFYGYGVKPKGWAMTNNWYTNICIGSPGIYILKCIEYWVKPKQVIGIAKGKNPKLDCLSFLVELSWSNACATGWAVGQYEYIRIIFQKRNLRIIIRRFCVLFQRRSKARMPLCLNSKSISPLTQWQRSSSVKFLYFGFGSIQSILNKISDLLNVLQFCFFWSPLVRRHLFWPPSMVYISVIITHLIQQTQSC